jgi:hypothetical protein
MTPNISIIIPHKRTKLNNLALELNLRMLQDNTLHSYELIIDTESPKDPYKIWNECAKQARADILIFTNSDVLMAPMWDVLFVEHMKDNAIFTGYLVEPGNIGVAAVNLPYNFGRSPVDFNRNTFEAFANLYKVQDIREERGWYMPCAFRRDWFLDTGGFDVTLGFPNPNDIIFWERCIKDYGTKLYRTRSFAYHFQNLSSRG